MKRCFTVIFIGLMPFTAIAADSTVSERLADYQSQGATDFSAQRGKAMWNEKHALPNGSSKISCASCHGADLTQTGEHIKTGKLIEPMAPSINRERLTDGAKIEKWFLRNCKGTLGRECTAQEKGDFLTYIQSN